ncbi:unnamed protein product [Rotaria sp. Silwood1]|nr:unnamed protein product [Rotaria sp. Silwood1]CAF4927246.1 unnamed protein product [Rotaria sp. Silwood1]
MSNRGALEGNNAFLKVTEQVVLKFDDDELQVKRAFEVTKKARYANQITPIHCAAMNPNAKYLKQLLTITSEVNIPDKRNRRPIHYAAVCEGTEPMKYLLSKDAKFNEVDKEGNTPLHLTAIHGRHENAEVLLRTAKEKAELNDPENQLEHEKFGLASINRMNASEHYSLHLAVINNHLKCVEVLLQYGAEIDALTAVSAEKLTSLMLACRIGSLDIVKCLVTNEARVEAHDRFKRTPLIHACMYGHAHVVSYLLRIGANPNVFDSSMNTALHYAIAYGWYFCVRLLMEAGANANCANCWLMTCLGIGVLKGHFGICDYLLKEHKADINFKTDNGLTTVILPLRLRISKTVLEQLEYIVVKHNADCTCIDINGQSAFHYLALNVNPQTNSTLSGSDESELRTYYFRMAKILLEHGCSPTQMDNKAQTPLALALGSTKLLLDKAKRGGDQVANNSTSDQNQDEQMKDTEINHTEAEAMDESSAFEEPTSIDLNATDALGRTCIHHLALPLLESYDVFYANNIELLELLHSAGASLIIPDQMGLTPLNYAAKQHGCKHLYDKLRELVNECPMEIEEIPRKRFIVNDPNNNLLGLPDYYSDAQQYIEEYIATQSMNISSSVYKVDPLSRMSETADVVIDSQNNEPFDVRLTITDVDDGLIGLYNFYRMQIIKQRTETDLYLLFSRWGRIGGSAGQHKLTPYSSIDECRAEFCKIFLEKTGNTWDNPNRFERQPKKYTVVQLKNTQTLALGNTHLVIDKTSGDYRAQLDTDKYQSRTAHGSSIPDPRCSYATG